MESSGPVNFGIVCLETPKAWGRMWGKWQGQGGAFSGTWSPMSPLLRALCVCSGFREEEGIWGVVLIHSLGLEFLKAKIKHLSITLCWNKFSTGRNLWTDFYIPISMVQYKEEPLFCFVLFYEIKFQHRLSEDLRMKFHFLWSNLDSLAVVSREGLGLKWH